jgi:hypothetical protein
MNSIETRQEDQTAAGCKSGDIFYIGYNTFRPRYLKGGSDGLNGNVQ